MNIRQAKASDAERISELINEYAADDRMLFRSISDIYESLQIFHVADNDDAVIVGCCALKVIWKDLAEIQSLAVDQDCKGKGIGRKLVAACVSKAAELGINKVFTLTLEPVFFEKCGFQVVNKSALPMKVWSDCARCPKQDNCDETALVIESE